MSIAGHTGGQVCVSCGTGGQVCVSCGHTGGQVCLSCGHTAGQVCVWCPEACPAAEELSFQVQRLSRLGETAFRHGQSSAALSHLQRAHLLSRRLPSCFLQYRCLFNLAAAYLQATQPGRALRCLLRYQRESDPDPDLLFNLGMAYEGLGQLAVALHCYRGAARLHKGGDPSLQADAWVKSAYCQRALGHGEAAANSFALAASGYQQAGRWEEAAMAMIEAASQMIASGRGLHTPVGRVLSLLQDCLQLCRSGVRDESLRVKLQTDVGVHLCELGLFPQAESCFWEMLGRGGARGPGGARQEAVLLQNLGAVLNAQRRYATAMAFHTQAALAFRSLGQTDGEVESLGNMACALHQQGQQQAAVRLYQHALAACQDTGDLQVQRLLSEGLTVALLHLSGGGGAGDGDAGGGGAVDAELRGGGGGDGGRGVGVDGGGIDGSGVEEAAVGGGGGGDVGGGGGGADGRGGGGGWLQWLHTHKASLCSQSGQR